MRDARHEQRVPIGRALGDELGADDAARARLVLYDHRHAERIGKARGDAACREVGDAAGRERDHHADWFARVRLRARRP